MEIGKKRLFQSRNYLETGCETETSKGKDKPRHHRRIRGEDERRKKRVRRILTQPDESNDDANRREPVPPEPDPSPAVRQVDGRECLYPARDVSVIRGSNRRTLQQAGGDDVCSKQCNGRDTHGVKSPKTVQCMDFATEISARF